MTTVLLLTAFLFTADSTKITTDSVDYLQITRDDIKHQFQEGNLDEYDLRFEARYRKEKLLHDSKLQPTFFCGRFWSHATV